MSATECCSNCRDVSLESPADMPSNFPFPPLRSSEVSLRSEDVLWSKGSRVVPLQEMELVPSMSRHGIAPSLDAVDENLCCVV